MHRDQTDTDAHQEDGHASMKQIRQLVRRHTPPRFTICLPSYSDDWRDLKVSIHEARSSNRDTTRAAGTLYDCDNLVVSNPCPGPKTTKRARARRSSRPRRPRFVATALPPCACKT